MTKRIGQPNQSDVTFWAVSALVAAGIGVLSTSLNAFIPQGVFDSLHASRIEGGTLNQLRAQVEQLGAAQRDLLSTTDQLRSQFTLSERNRAEVNQRVGALEVSIPMLLEVVPPGMEIDPLSITASIEKPEAVSFDAEGGSVTLTHSPLFEGAINSDENEPDAAQPLIQELTDQPEMPAELGPDTESAGTTSSVSALDVLPEVIPQNNATIALSRTQYGIAVGPSVLQSEADALWRDISGKIGTLLIGLEPAISDPLQNDNFRVVLGPITNYSEAEMLCRRISMVGIDCLPIQYANQQLDAL